MRRDRMVVYLAVRARVDVDEHLIEARDLDERWIHGIHEPAEDVAHDIAKHEAHGSCG